MEFPILQNISDNINSLVTEGMPINNSIFEKITSFGTLAAVFVALFAVFWPQINKFIKRPKILIEFGNKDPFCRHTNALIFIGPTGGKVEKNSYHMRLRIKNSGKSVLKKCEVKLVSIINKDIKSTRDDFDPVVLHWVGSDELIRNIGEKETVKLSKKTSIDINSGEYEYIDLLSTTDGHTNYEIQAIDRDIPRGITFDPERNDYYLLITVYSENCDPKNEVYILKNNKKYDQIQINTANNNDKQKVFSIVK